MEQASAWHSGMVPWVVTFATLGISNSSAKRCKQNPKNHRSRRQGEAKTINKIFRPQKKHDQTTLAGNTVDFSSFWCILGP